MKAKIDPVVEHPVVVVSLYSNDMRIVAQYNSYFNSIEFKNRGGTTNISLTIDRLFLNPGMYTIAVGIMGENNSEVLTRVDNVSSLKVEGSFYGYAPVQLTGQWDVNKGSSFQSKRGD